jgi:hypothetical protein
VTFRSAPAKARGDRQASQESRPCEPESNRLRIRQAQLQLSDLVAARASPRAVIVVSHVRFAKHGSRNPTLATFPAGLRRPSDRPRGESIQQVANHAVGELWFEPGRFRRHDCAGVGDRHEVAHLRRIERECDGHPA